MFDLELDSQILHSKLIIWSIEALIVLGAMSVDLISGVNKARQRGEATTSRLLRKSISKFITYEGCLFLGLLVDLLIYLGRIFEVCHKIFDFNHLFLGIPVISSVMAVFLVGIEIKSVFEKADQKFSNAAVDEFLLLKNLAKTLGPAKLKDVIEVLEETKKQKDELKAEEKAKKEKEKEEKKKKKEEEKLKKRELDEVKKIEELRKQLLELEQDNIITKPVSKRGRKKKITTEDTHNDDRG